MLVHLHSEKSNCRVGQSVKTPPFHGGMTSSTLVRGTKKRSIERFFLLNFMNTIF